MQTTEAELQTVLGTRLSDLSEWLAGALEIGELRDKQTVDLAKEALLRWLCEGWDGGAGDTDGALAWALESYVGFGPRWADKPISLQSDLAISADPAWTIPEFHLVASSVFADQALLAFKRGSRKQVFLAAMLYADAVECREQWSQLRGPAGARNPETRLGRVHTALRAQDERIAGEKAQKLAARKAIKAKLQRDPKQAAKAEAFRMWQAWQAGEVIHASGAAFARHVVEQTVIEDPNSVQRWMRKWRADHGRNR